MNPLSPLTYYRRHKRRALLLTSLITLVTLGICVMVGLLNSFLDNTLATVDFLTRYSLVVSLSAQSVEPAVVSQIRTQPDVDRVIPTKVLEILVPSRSEVPLQMMGVSEADAQYLMRVCGLRLKEGRLPAARTNEIALSHEVASALGLRLGDKIGRSINRDYYANIPTELVLAGILEGDPSTSGATRVAPGERQVGRSIRTGFASYEYLDGHELYASQPSGLIVVPKQGHKAAVDNFLQNTIRSKQTNVMTYGQLLALLGDLQQTLLLLLGFVDCVVAFVMALVVAAINQIAFTRRLPEFGTLNAAGYSPGWLARRLTLEMAGLALAGWALGIGFAWGVMAILNACVYAPKGFAYNPFQLTVFPFVIPMPLAVIGFTLFAAVRALGRMDAVAIVERGELSLEGEQPGRRAKARVTSLPRPLACATFYRRHKRQVTLLIGAMTLMVLSVSQLVFTFTTVEGAVQPGLSNLNYMSLVAPNTIELEPDVIAQIRTHPAVERVIPAYTVSLFGLAIPPFYDGYPVETYSVPAEDMAYLVDLYHLKLAEGRLPRPNTNEVILAWTVARNRNLKVGDVIGDPERPIHAFAPTLPSELVVSGIFAQAGNPAEDTWLNFMSQEFINNYRSDWKTDLSLIVVPKAGQKAALDAWLENEIASNKRNVSTYGKNHRNWGNPGQNCRAHLSPAGKSLISSSKMSQLGQMTNVFGI